MPKNPLGNFVFRKHDNIGSADAEEDTFLDECFVDNGDLNALRDCSNPKRLIVGRTGSGKSALLMKLRETEKRCIEVKPESLSLSYISNSTILRFLGDLGVKLDIFFKLLWRHVFAVEVIKYHFKIDNEQTKRSFLDRIWDIFQDKKHRNAIEYLKKWGETFWEETEYRIKELTQKLEKDLKAAVASKLPIVEPTAEFARRMTEEQKSEIIQRAQHVVNEVQIRQLSDILELLRDVLEDEQKKYFIVIDRLDEDWIEDSLRYRLIRALVETSKDFRTVRYVKIITAVRVDLLERVFRVTRDPGFQEEKYEALYLPVTWQKSQLVELLDRRIDALIRKRYTKQKVTHKEILPAIIDDKATLDYMLDRTMMRPRDLILFFNECLEKAETRPQLTVQMIRDAEAEYSVKRLRSLAEEWFSDYPNLIEAVPLMRGRNRLFSINAIPKQDIEDLCLRIVTDQKSKQDPLYQAADRYIEQQDPLAFLQDALQIFHRVGLIGIKVRTNEPILWTASKTRTIGRSEIDWETRVQVHPAYWRVLGNQR